MKVRHSGNSNLYLEDEARSGKLAKPFEKILYKMTMENEQKS